MVTRSIYHKVCPSCASLVKTDADICDCGFSFNADLEAEQSVQEEELFTAYLSARIDQSVSLLQGLQEELNADPKNLDKATKVLQAFKELRDLRAQLQEQSVRLGIAQETAKTGEVAATSPEPTESFRAAQSAKAAKVMEAAGMHTKQCPKCRNVVPETTPLCFCGFHFGKLEQRQPTETPSATLDQPRIRR